MLRVQVWSTSVIAAGTSSVATYPCSEAAWVAATPDLDFVERHALWRLLSYLWRHGAPLPGRAPRLAAIAGVDLRRWDETAARLAPFFTLDHDRRWTCPELLARRRRVIARRQAAAAAAASKLDAFAAPAGA